VARLTFVVGKGGVGKTTVSCALALHLAAGSPRKPVLLMSTDPAHSLADMLQTSLASEPKRLAAASGKIFAWQIDAAREFAKFLAGNRNDILNIVETGTFFSREEIAPLLDTTLPGMAEVAGLLALQEMLETGKYEHIVVDTAPFGHTLRLFELPGHFQRFLDFLEVAASRDEVLAQHFGGRVKRPRHGFLERWQSVMEQLRAAFSAEQAEICLVTTPETFSLNEAERSVTSLRESVPEMKVGKVVLNRVVEAPGRCPYCRSRVRTAHVAMEFLNRLFPRTTVLTGPDPGNPVLGIQHLRSFGNAVFARRKTKLEKNGPKQTARALKLEKTAWPQTSTQLSFTAGKGGVGKTTITAALAFHARQSQNISVTVCSTDPAPSLDDVFQKSIGSQRVSVLDDAKFLAMELDSAGEFRRWSLRVKKKLNAEMSMEQDGLHVDLTFEKQVFSALVDIVPPGVDEIFAIFRILELVEESNELAPGLVFIDMAPTGHALELLHMPERMLLWLRLLLKSLAAHRTLALAQDIAVDLATLGQQVRRLLEIMKDVRRSRLWAVMLPELVPGRQTERLLKAIEELGITVDSLFVNRVLMEESGCRRCQRARQWQQATLAVLRKKYPHYSLYVAPEFSHEIAGTVDLRKFTGELWRIV
jgi:arsenite-transporting ATPase